MSTPFIVYGDGPRLPSGLARIARDLCGRLVGESEALDIRVLQVGVDPPDGWHWQGWDFFAFQPQQADQGRRAVRAVIEQMALEDPTAEPVVLMIMDPSRCFDLTHGIQPDPDEASLPLPPIHYWGYFPIDSENVGGMIGGPAAQAVAACERVLGYGRYGAQVLQRTLEQQQAQARTKLQAPLLQDPPRVRVPFLPHGLEPIFRPGVPLDQADPGFAAWRRALPADTWLLGCIATNQPRKDLGLLFSTMATLRARGCPVALWLHTDRTTNAWDIGQLAHDFALPRPLICVSTTELQDLQLAARYCATTVTIAPGLGEGFGYPIVESLACGTPVIHGDYAGGVELIPVPAWRVGATAWRLEGVYGVKRPVFHPEDLAGAVTIAVGQVQAEPAVIAAYCAGAVAHLHWGALWPRWHSWIARGLTSMRQEQAAAQALQQARMEGI